MKIISFEYNAMSLMKPITLKGKALAEGQRPAICCPLVGNNTQDLLDELKAVLATGPDLVEWRVDHFEALTDQAAVLEAAQALRQNCPLPILYTWRSPREGGVNRMVEPAVLESLVQRLCQENLIDLVDCEMSAPEEHFQKIRNLTREAGVLLVASFHDFSKTPSRFDLLQKLGAAQAMGADVAKVAVMPNSPEDVLSLLGATTDAARILKIPVITLAMGELGKITRTHGGLFGNSLTFAVGDQASAPGQIPVGELKRLMDY
jgi:3-dehydroquinate dehydratase-1